MIALRALTLIQPMGQAIIWGSKRIENRSQDLPIAMRGVPTWVAIHAGKKWSEDYYGATWVIDGTDHKRIESAIIGVAHFTGRVFVHEPPRAAYHVRIRTHEFAAHRWFRGVYGYEIDDVRVLATPLPCRGALGFWRVPSDLAAPVLAEIARAA